MSLLRVSRLLSEDPDSAFWRELHKLRDKLDRERARLAGDERAQPGFLRSTLDAWSQVIQGLLDGVRLRDVGKLRRSLDEADRLLMSPMQGGQGRRERGLALLLVELRDHIASLGGPGEERGATTREVTNGVTVLSELEQAIEATTASYVRTTPFVRIESAHGTLSLTIKDILLLGAITGCDVLLLGRTGTGKTKLATKVMEALFGENGYYAKTTLPSMSPADFMDIDFPAIRSGKKTLKEAIQGVPALTNPGVVINEANRAPALVQAMLIPFLDREFEIEGKPVAVGVEHGAERYQYRILTINEGEQYAVEEMDRAIRDRTVIEVPLDLFPQSAGDVRDMLSRSLGGPAGSHSPGHLAAVLRLHEEVRQIPIAETARGFIAYLAGLGNCIRSVSGTKEGISFTPDICAGCRHTKHFFNLCGSIRAPSPRGLVNLQRVAQGVALLRARRTGISAVAVTIEDVLAAGPMVLLNKLEVNPMWLVTAGPKGKEFQGCLWIAIGAILEFLVGRYSRFTSTCGDAFAKYVSRTPLSADEVELMRMYAQEEDAWGVNLAELKRREQEERAGMERPIAPTGEAETRDTRAKG